MAVSIRLPYDSPAAGDSYCFVVCTSGAGPPEIRVRVDDGPIGTPAEIEPIGNGKYIVCVPVPAGAGTIQILVGGGGGGAARKDVIVSG